MIQRRTKRSPTIGESRQTVSPCIKQVLETVPSKGRQWVSRHTALGLHSPVVRTLHSQCRKHGFNSWSGNQDSACQAQSKGKKKKIHKHMIRVVINLVSKHKLFTAEKNQHLYKYNSFKILEPVNSQFTLSPRQIICPHTS